MGLDLYFSIGKRSRREGKEEVDFIDIENYRKVNFLVPFFEDRGLDVEEQTPLKISKKDVVDLMNTCIEVKNDFYSRKSATDLIKYFNKSSDSYFIEASDLEMLDFYTPSQEDIESNPKLTFMFRNILKSIFVNNDIPEDIVPNALTKEDVLNINTICNNILYSNLIAPNILPTQAGFFFGSTEYDKEYFEDIDSLIIDCEENIIPTFDDLEEDEDMYFRIWY